MSIKGQTDALSERTLQRLKLALSAGRLVAWEYSGNSGQLEVSGPVEATTANAPASRRVELEDAMMRVHKSDRQRVRKAFAADLPAGSVDVIEYRIRNGSGSLRWVRNHIMALDSDGGHPRDKSGISRQITQTVRAGHRGSYGTLLEEHLQTLEHAPLAILTLDTRGVIQMVNHAGMKLTGFAESQVLGKIGLGFVHADDRRATAEAYVNLISGTVVHAVLPHRLRLAQNGFVHVQTHFAVVHDGRGKPEKVIAMLQDMTDQMAREKEIDEHREKLAHVSRLGTMGQMAAGLAHEINQPLSAIATYAQACRRMLNRGNVDCEEFRIVLDQVTDQAHRAGDVIRRMRVLARGTASIRVECQMEQLISEMLPLVNSEAHHADVAIQLQLASDMPSFVGDPVQIQQVLLNLMRNGVDAMRTVEKAQRILCVRAEMIDGGQMRVSVEDYGTGVESPTDTHLFDPFFTTKENGMGMGLSISQSIAKAHGGKIGFEPNSGGGSVFWFTIPTETMRQPA